MIRYLRRRATMVDENAPAPVTLNLLIVGDNAPSGDVRAGKYTLLDLDTMKQVVGTSSEVTDNYKVYYGPIIWSLVGNNGSLENNSGTETYLTLSASGSFTLSVNVQSNIVSKNISATFEQTKYLISSFADLKEIERCVNNGVESTITIPLAAGASYTPVDGNGFNGALFRLNNDIDCNQDYFVIGNTGSVPFNGNFDGSWHKIYNLKRTDSHNCFIRTMGTCIVRNVYLFGSVANGSGLAICSPTNNCSIKNMYFGIDQGVTTGSTNSIGAWATNKSITIENVVINNKVQVNNNYNSFGCDQTTTIKNCINIQDVDNKNYDVGVGAAYAKFIDCCFLPNVSQKRQGSDLACLRVSYQGSTNRCYEAMNIDSSVGVQPSRLYWRYSASGNVLESYSLNNLNNATSKTKAQLQSGNLFNHANWLEVEGYYPLPINNPFITDAAVLEKIRA